MGLICRTEKEISDDIRKKISLFCNVPVEAVLEERDGQRTFVFRQGPLFANLVLADEINRASPKTQSALLEAMEEGNVTIDGTTYPLPHPFFVLATQNPIEQHGTYMLAEAQIDRFMMKLRMGYLICWDARLLPARQNLLRLFNTSFRRP